VNGAPGSWWPASAPVDSWSPAAVLCLPTSDLIVADRNQNRLFRLRDPGTMPYRLPSPGTTPVEWTALSRAPGLSFYALDGPGRRIHQFDLNGNYLGVALDLDELADDRGLGSIDPAGLAVVRSGQAVVTDRFGDRLLAFGPGWVFQGEWGRTGSEPGAWRRPARVAAGDRPPFLVADEGNDRVVLVDDFGEVIATRDLPDSPRGVAVIDVDRYAVSYADVVEILDGHLDPVRRIPVPPGPGCASSPYVTTALDGGDDAVWAGEGCSGGVLQIPLEEK
jgi:hypothetical protein